MGDIKSQKKNLNFLLFLIWNKKTKKEESNKKRITKKNKMSNESKYMQFLKNLDKVTNDPTNEEENHLVTRTTMGDYECYSIEYYYDYQNDLTKVVILVAGGGLYNGNAYATVEAYFKGTKDDVILSDDTEWGWEYCEYGKNPSRRLIHGSEETYLEFVEEACYKGHQIFNILDCNRINANGIKIDYEGEAVIEEGM